MFLFFFADEIGHENQSVVWPVIFVVCKDPPETLQIEVHSVHVVGAYCLKNEACLLASSLF